MANSSSAIACGLLSILNGMFFGYALIGISTAAYTLWQCVYGISEDTPQNRLIRKKESSLVI